MVEDANAQAIERETVRKEKKANSLLHTRLLNEREEVLEEEKEIQSLT